MREVVTNSMLLLVAGNETTTNLIGNAMHCFEEYPDSLQALRDDPTLIPNALEEVLRYRSPIQRTPRIAKEDTMIADHPIQKGQVVYCWLGAANRDPEQFPHPEQFEITRSPNRHLAFGQGIHFCLGASLARIEAKIALECLLERFSDIRRDQNMVLQPTDTFFGLGVKAYPVMLQSKK
jgi:cytochrome P450